MSGKNIAIAAAIAAGVFLLAMRQARGAGVHYSSSGEPLIFSSGPGGLVVDQNGKVWM